MKYFQPLGYIGDHLDRVIEEYNRGTTGGLQLLETWEIKPEDIQDIQEEKEVIRYLMSCHLGIAREKNVHKPALEVVNRCFERHLVFLDHIHDCNRETLKTYKNPLAVKRYKACRHYLFQFSLPAWYKNLPDVILSFENKYPKCREEGDLQIPNS